MRERVGTEIAIDDIQAGARPAQAFDDGGGKLSADRVGAEHAGVDMQEFHVEAPGLVLVCNWRYMSDRPKSSQERTNLSPEHTHETRAHPCACLASVAQCT